MNYVKIYYDLCVSRRSREVKTEDGYELHHIIPRSFGGFDTKDNLVKLSYREHFIAHRLLAKFSRGVRKSYMNRAIKLMMGGKNTYARKYDADKQLKVNVGLINYLSEIDRHMANYSNTKRLPLLTLRVRGIQKGNEATRRWIRRLINVDGNSYPTTPRRVSVVIKLLKILKHADDNNFTWGFDKAAESYPTATKRAMDLLQRTGIIRVDTYCKNLPSKIILLEDLSKLKLPKFIIGKRFDVDSILTGYRHYQEELHTDSLLYVKGCGKQRYRLVFKEICNIPNTYTEFANKYMFKTLSHHETLAALKHHKELCKGNAMIEE